MNIETIHIPYQNTQRFSKLVIDYVSQSETLKNYIQEFPSKEAIGRQIERKQQQSIDRFVLKDVLESQYKGFELGDSLRKNLNALIDANTFTICTAHQPIIFTGPLYFIYKIIHAINLAKECEALYPKYKFVPVFYMGSEDNDLDEIGTFQYQDKTLKWNTSQEGACGRMNTNDLVPLVDEIVASLNEQIEEEAFLISLFRKAYNAANTLAEATRIVIHELFGGHGLLILDGDDARLKKQFSEVILNELIHQDSIEYVAATTTQLAAWYKVQAHPREINLFYLLDDVRERIEQEGDSWKVLHTNMSFTRTELEQEVKLHPERFSPNVILRPLYQETLLPNIAFIGGGGELAYWLELKLLFEKHKIVYPLIFLRNSVLWINEKTSSLIDRLKLKPEDLFKAEEELVKKHIHSLEPIKKLNLILDEIKISQQKIIELGSSISSPTEKSMQAHIAKLNRIQERIAQKLNAGIKKKEEATIAKIRHIQNEVLPNDTLQERSFNFLTIYKWAGFEMFDLLLKNQEAFGDAFLIVQAPVHS